MKKIGYKQSNNAFNLSSKYDYYARNRYIKASSLKYVAYFLYRANNDGVTSQEECSYRISV